MNQKIFNRICLIATILAFVVVALGAYTRLKNAGLGCPDWPGCYGHFMPDAGKALSHSPQIEYHAPKAWAEMVHRYFAGTLALMILGLFLISFWNRWSRRNTPTEATPKAPLFLPSLLLLVVIFQAALGMFTVTWKLHPVVVMGHLLGGLTTLGLLFLLYLTSGLQSQPVPPDSKKCSLVWLKTGFVLLVLQIALGGWVSSNYAALSCPDFPTCLGKWVPQLNLANLFYVPFDLSLNYEGGILSPEIRANIHWLHRFFALVVFAVYLRAVLPFFKKRNQTRCYQCARVILLLMLLQIVLGISNVLMLLPLPIAVWHNVNAAALMLATVLLMIQASKE